MTDGNLLDARTIQRRVKALAARLDEPDFTIRTEPMGDGSPHIEVSDAYYFVVSERGTELERRKTTDIDELLYWIMDGLTASISWDYELKHRREGEDFRIVAFTKRMELLRKLSPDWEERWRNEHWQLLTELRMRPEERPHSNSTII